MLLINHLTKKFGTFYALDDINFIVKDSSILGLIGKNGAGKSTLFHCILNLLSYKGNVYWNGEQLDEKNKNEIGYLPEERGLLPNRTVLEQIIYFGRLRGLKTNELKIEIPKWLDQFNILEKESDQIQTLSKGNQQKVQLISTLIHKPKLIILDEPFSGLDPINANLLKKSILQAKEKGASIIFSDHNMENVAEICDYVALFKSGHLKLYNTVSKIRDSYGCNQITVSTELSIMELKNIPHILKIEKLSFQKYKLTIENEIYGPMIFKYITNGKYIKTFDQEPPTLSEIFTKEA
ncbi:Fe(3+)-transporting ATPase [Liquorilactobacillus ghanensis DSM 18630]|uniref:Fe(3+)-transporting ATPase n=1 Tax=Liquorilactobacillus ghanensis DSM 18630 TaxID=1423750 RepID=A0A0R1VH34_9LACO|nr:ATP-binding cassette domain-containing protein [Liquorilactobacillus ghanensis]KRM04605.1 Fe(3+)-transporting ATPase [Liquorilactobacillus ghanensis DSM 18630]